MIFGKITNDKLILKEIIYPVANQFFIFIGRNLGKGDLDNPMSYMQHRIVNVTEQADHEVCGSLNREERLHQFLIDFALGKFFD